MKISCTFRTFFRNHTGNFRDYVSPFFHNHGIPYPNIESLNFIGIMKVARLTVVPPSRHGFKIGNGCNCSQSADLQYNSVNFRLGFF
jgi:hypothetical protein